MEAEKNFYNGMNVREMAQDLLQQINKDDGIYPNWQRVEHFIRAVLEREEKQEIKVHLTLDDSQFKESLKRLSTAIETNEGGICELIKRHVNLRVGDNNNPAIGG